MKDKLQSFGDLGCGHPPYRSHGLKLKMQQITDENVKFWHSIFLQEIFQEKDLTFMFRQPESCSVFYTSFLTNLFLIESKTADVFVNNLIDFLKFYTFIFR